MNQNQKAIFSDDFLKNDEIDFMEFKFVGKLAGKAWQLEQAVEKIRRARLILFILGGMIILPSLVMYLQTGDKFLVVLSFIIGSFFILAGLMVKKKPIVSIIIPLILYIALVMIEANGDIIALYRGIVWKVIIIFLLGYGAYSAIIAKKVKYDLIDLAKKASNQAPAI